MELVRERSRNPIEVGIRWGSGGPSEKVQRWCGDADDFWRISSGRHVSNIFLRWFWQFFLPFLSCLFLIVFCFSFSLELLSLTLISVQRCLKTMEWSFLFVWWSVTGETTSRDWSKDIAVVALDICGHSSRFCARRWKRKGRTLICSAKVLHCSWLLVCVGHRFSFRLGCEGPQI